uniref:ABC transporter domain-containing protein n=1 Tax=Biomphalaria glabrata TaxID=6526 RepID=A0A2C9KLM3_BIOGL
MEEYLDFEPQRLSGGQKQKVAIASVLALNTEIIIFDESTSMLDPKSKRELRALMIDICHIKNLRQSVGQVFQFAEYQLFEDTVKKDILFGLKSLGQKKTQEYYDGAANKYIKLVGLKTEFLDSSPFELSGGQKRRVAIAGILAMDPDVIIFDEPTAGLDPDGEIEIMKIIESLQKEHHKTIIFITHNMDHVLEHADNVIVMKNGEITATGTPIEIFEDKSIIEKNDLLLPKVYEIIHDARLVNELRKYKKEVRNIKDLAKFIL